MTKLLKLQYLQRGSKCSKYWVGQGPFLREPRSSAASWGSGDLPTQGAGFCQRQKQALEL